MASVEQRQLLSTYFFFFAVAFFLAGAFFFALEAPFFAAFLFIGMFASLLRSVAGFEPSHHRHLPQQPPTTHTPCSIKADLPSGQQWNGILDIFF